MLKGPAPVYTIGLAFRLILESPEKADEEVVRPYLDSKLQEERFAALEVLARLGRRDVLPILVRMPERGVAYRLMGVLGDPEAGEPLARAARTDEWQIARIALEALGRVGGPEAEKFLIWCAGEEKAGRLVVEAWPIVAGLTRHRATVPVLIEMIRRGPSREALWALDAIVHSERYRKFTGRSTGAVGRDFAAGAREYGVEFVISDALRAPEGTEGYPCVERGGADGLADALRQLRATVTVAQFSWYQTYEIPLAHVFDGPKLRFMTRDEAREWWLAWWDAHASEFR